MDGTLLERIKNKIKDGKKLTRFENAIFKMLDEDEQHKYFTMVSEISEDVGDICSEMAEERARGSNIDVMNMLVKTHSIQQLDEVLKREDLSDSIKQKVRFFKKNSNMPDEVKVPIQMDKFDDNGNLIGKITYEELEQLPVNIQGNNIVSLLDNNIFEVLLYGVVLGYVLSKEGIDNE